MAEIQPMEQFLIHKVVAIPPITVGGVTFDLSLTNSVITMLGAALFISLFFVASARRQVVPGRLQAFGEIVYDLVDKGLTGPMIGDRGRPFLPYVFALFCLIAVMNIWGIVPGSFTVTSQLAVTISLAVAGLMQAPASFRNSASSLPRSGAEACVPPHGAPSSLHHALFQSQPFAFGSPPPASGAANSV